MPGLFVEALDDRSYRRSLIFERMEKREPLICIVVLNHD